MACVKVFGRNGRRSDAVRMSQAGEMVVGGGKARWWSGHSFETI